MTVLFPTSVAEAVAEMADPGVQILAGGTDFMVEVNAGRRRPPSVLSLRRIPELRRWEHVGEVVRLGAAVTYTQLLEPPLSQLLPALAQAARTVGSPQIRNAGTIGGNLGTASPAGDLLPVLSALEAVVEVAGPLGLRDVPMAEFVTGPKRNDLQAGELIVAVRVPLLAGHQEFRKVGVRNAMVIAVVSLAFALDTHTRTVRCALGSAGPTPLRAPEAEEWLAARVDWEAAGGPALAGVAGAGGPALAGVAGAGGPGAAGVAGAGGAGAAGAGAAGPADLGTFGSLVAGAARPIDDHRSTAGYRRHAVAVLAQRAARQALSPTAPDAAA